MSAYLIFIRNTTTDPEGLATYVRKAGPTGEGHPHKVLAFHGAVEVLEGDPAEALVMVQFEDMARAKAWYESPAYQDAKTHRLKSADYRVLLVEGLAG